MFGTPPASDTMLDTLNDAQREAVQALNRPVLVLAGAGTGKTRVLVTRIVHILTQQRAHTNQILAVTFTNKAAQEMKHRISTLLHGPAEGLWMGTFHSICVRILRTHAAHIGRTADFVILDTDDQIRLMKQIIQSENIDEKAHPPRAVAMTISRWKDKGWGPEAVPPADARGKTRRIYQIYQERLSVLNALDFGDLLLETIQLFSKHPDILRTYHAQFKFILVDEYQDTNVAQYLWLRLLAQGGANVCCVGDDDQSIYGWRGAEVGNILRFEKDFPDAAVVRLEQNYRSTPHILGAASGLITNNQERLGKTLWTEIDQGHLVTVCGTWDGEAEACMVIDEIQSLQRQKVPLSSMAVLVRAGFQTREFEERFIATGVPYRVVGSSRFYEHMEIRDAMAYLRVVVHPHDSLAFERIINTPRRGVGAVTIKALHEYGRAEKLPMTQAAEHLIAQDALPAKAQVALTLLLQDLARWRSLKDQLKPSALTDLILNESGYISMWKSDKAPEAPARLDNLKEFIRGLEGFEDLGKFLEHISLVMDNNINSHMDSVMLMTLHSAKGLEFDTVFLVGWEEGVFPNPRSLDEQGGAGIEEERRLAYVGLTRARRRAYISFATNRRVHGTWQSSTPSRFIQELPKEHYAVRNWRGGFIQETEVRRPARAAAPSSAANNPSPPLRIAKAVSPPRPGLQTGQRVFHEKFGYGVIRSVEGDKLAIMFQHTGLKRVMSNFIKKVE